MTTAEAETSVDGLEFDSYIEVDGVTFRAKANGPSFFNGLGKFSLGKVNAMASPREQTSESIDGSIGKDGALNLTAQRGQLGASLRITDLTLARAFGALCADQEFLDVIEAVKRGFDAH